MRDEWKKAIEEKPSQAVKDKVFHQARAQLDQKKRNGKEDSWIKSPAVGSAWGFLVACTVVVVLIFNNIKGDLAHSELNYQLAMMNTELIQEIDLFEHLELLENLEDFENMDET